MATVAAVIQARVGSTRLPGKVMYPLEGKPVLERITKRVSRADCIDDVVVATSTEPQDDVIAEYIQTLGTAVVRGSETNVLGRFERVFKQYEPDIVVRLTGDNPLVSVLFIQECVNRVRTENVDYVSEGPDRTFPLGSSCEAFTADSFERVRGSATDSRHREHVTVSYKDHPDEFNTSSIKSRDLFDEERFQERTDLRLTLDEPADYHLFRTVYQGVSYGEVLDLRDAISYIDDNDIVDINSHVEQKTV